MARKKLKPERKVEYLSVLDAKGRFDKDVAPDVDDELVARMYRAMRRARLFDERLLQLQRQGRIGTFAPVKGQEAAQIGAVATLNDDDWLVPAFRETAALLWRGISMSGMLLYNAGFNEGGAIPEDQYSLPIAIPVASQIPHAVGLAYAMKQREEERIAMTFFGDGATSQGDFHEALNFAAVLQTPTVFVCQNNHWAISVPRSRQTKSKTLAQKALAYDVPAIQVDGNDVFAVYAAAREAADRARDGDGPTMIECITYRMEVHTTADDPSRYRSDEEVAKWAKRDPIARLETYLIGEEILAKDGPDKIDAEIESEIDAAWKEAEKQIGSIDAPDEMFAHVYAERTPQIEQSHRLFDRARSGDDPSDKRSGQTTEGNGRDRQSSADVADTNDRKDQGSPCDAQHAHSKGAHAETEKA